MHLSDDEIWDYYYSPEGRHHTTLKTHMHSCTYCTERLAVFLNDEVLLRKLDFPTVTKGFANRTTNIVMAKFQAKQTRWTHVLRSSLIFSFSLVFGVIIYHLYQQDSANLIIPKIDMSRWSITYIPLIVLLLLMRIMDHRSKMHQK